MRKCACGCQTITKGGEFAPGHDAKHRSELLRKWREEQNHLALTELRDRDWLEEMDLNRTFGVEIECLVDPEGGSTSEAAARRKLAEALNAEGIEAEVGHSHTATASKNAWLVTRDGSIHRNDLNARYQPLEIVSPILKGTDGLKQLQEVLLVLNEQFNAKVNKSTGLHVHHGASNLKVKDLRELVKLYYDNEPHINQMVPESRHDGYYCRSLNGSQWSNFNHSGIQNSYTFNTLLRKVDKRYYSLNLRAYLAHETVEFRQHAGSTDFEKIKHWVIFGQKLIQLARRGSNSPFATLFDEVELTKDQKTWWEQRIDWLQNLRIA